MERRKIACHYFKTWFPLDFFIVGLDWFMILLGGMRSANGLMRIGKLFRAMRILRTLRLLRLAKLKQIMAMVQDRLDSEYLTITLSVIKLMVLIVAINHFIACVWFRLGNMEVDGSKNNSWVYFYGFNQVPLSYQYLTSFHWSLTQFTPASMNVNPNNVNERLFAVLVLLFAMIVFSSFVSSITAAMNQLRNLGTKNGSQLWLLRKYLREQCVSRDLYLRLTRYATVTAERLEKKVHQRDVLYLNLLSGPLRVELTTELFKPVLTVNPFFDRLGRQYISLMQKICCTALATVSFSRGDILFHPGEEASSMYLLTKGHMWYSMLAQMKFSDEPMNSQSKSSAGGTDFKIKEWCCEAVLWVPWVHCGRMRAKAESEVATLDAKRFRELAVLHPASMPFLRIRAQDWACELNTKGLESIDDLHGIEDIPRDYASGSLTLEHRQAED